MLETEKKKSKDVAQETWESWLVDLEEQEQPSCNVNDEDECTSCGS